MNVQSGNIYTKNAKMSILHYLQNVCSNPATNHRKILLIHEKSYKHKNILEGNNTHKSSLNNYNNK